MDGRKRAWTYCSIDAPEDTHGTLKGQYRQLVEYAEQMGFEVVDGSSDIGNNPLWDRAGFQRFADKAKAGEVSILLITSPHCLSRSALQLAQLQALMECYGIEVYSPLMGRVDILSWQKRRASNVSRGI